MPQTIVIDGVSYNEAKLSPKARETLQSIKFVDAAIQQKQSEWAVADTARMAYVNALKREMKR